jgi:hypothetical protein
VLSITHAETDMPMADTRFRRRAVPCSQCGSRAQGGPAATKPHV